MDIARKNWSLVVAAGCGRHYFVSARFGSFQVVENFSTTERFKHLFFTAMKIHTMVRIVKKQSNFVFNSLVFSYINLADVFHLYCRIWNNRTGTII